MDCRLQNPMEWRNKLGVGVEGIVAGRKPVVAVEVASGCQHDARCQSVDTEDGVADPKEATRKLEDL